MAQVKLLKIDADGTPLEFQAADDITLNSFTAGSGPVVSPTGVDMKNQDLSDLKNIVFNDPAVNTIYQTAGALIIDNIMAKDRSNSMTAASDILFGVATDTAAQVDAFKVPHMATIPTASPAANSNPGFLVSSQGSLWVWDGAAWNDLGTSEYASQVVNNYVADEALSARDVLYISAADSVSKALADNTSKSYAIGLAKQSVADAATVQVMSEGLVDGFSGLTAGDRYYLSDSAAGAVTSTVPSGSGKTIVQIGYAKSATSLQLHIEQMGRRA